MSDTDDDFNFEPTATIALAAERAHVDIRRKEDRLVVVRAETREAVGTVSADLQDARVEVSRVAVGREVSATPEVRAEGDVTIFPVMEERLVFRRQLVLKEEIHVRRVVETRTEELPVTLRREHAVVERIDARTGQILSQDIISTEEDKP